MPDVSLQIITLKPEDHRKSTMLKITAGSKLDNVIVEDEHVGKDLLEHSGIKKHMTLIPLNKIHAFKLCLISSLAQMVARMNWTDFYNMIPTP
jgi:chromosome segregation ATPase